jgi:hypothetical protein
MYGPVINSSSATCDYTFTNPVLLYSHDEVHNLGHTISDFMNVFAMLWLSGLGPHAHSVSFFNVDAIREGAAYKDETTAFFKHYELSFKEILKASQFGPNAKLCFKQLVFMPRPLLLFTWDGWWQDMKCSYVGPSSLFQRWNLQIRNSYGLLVNNNRPMDRTNESPSKLRVLLIVRKAKKDGGADPKYVSRVFSNEVEIKSALQTLPNIELLSVDLETLTFEAQVKLIGEVGLVIGMHGAGITHTMHMAIGTPNCCGVIEIFPPGEFVNIKVHYYYNVM